MRQLFFLYLILIFLSSSSQTTGLAEQICKRSVSELITPQKETRNFLKFKKKRSYYNPLAYLSAALLFGYQNVVSEQLQAECVYEISCSEYTKRLIQKDGFLIGILGGFNQLSECYNGAYSEHPPVYVDSQHKIINGFD